MVPPTSRRVSRVPRYSGYCCLLFDFVYETFTLFGRLSQNRSTIVKNNVCSPLPRCARTPVWALSLSLAATQEIDVSFSSSGYLDVSVPRVPFIQLCIYCMMTGVRPAGFPHSEIHGSRDICSSPWLIAAYHVFLRLSVPRHPPRALFSLTSLPSA